MMPQHKQQQRLQPHHPPDPRTPEGDEIGGSGTAMPTNKRKKVVTAGDVAVLVPPETDKAENPVSSSDGATIEMARKPRGRPPGSKNKPKPPMVVTHEADSNAMSPHILEVPSGCDVVEAVAQFVWQRRFGLCVISGTGSVSNVTFRQPTHPGSTVTINDRFDILSLSATYLPSGTAASPAVVNSGGFTISLAGSQGQVVGGTVVGPLRAVGTVVIVAASFANPSYHRLPIEEEHTSETRTQMTPPTSSVITDSCAMASVYPVCPIPMSCHLPSEIFWTPPARRPPPPY